MAITSATKARMRQRKRDRRKALAAGIAWAGSITGSVMIGLATGAAAYRAVADLARRRSAGLLFLPGDVFGQHPVDIGLIALRRMPLEPVERVAVETQGDLLLDGTIVGTAGAGSVGVIVVGNTRKIGCLVGNLPERLQAVDLFSRQRLRLVSNDRHRFVF